MGEKPRLLVLSHVPPLPRTSGQRQRVFQTLLALRQGFHLTLACLDPKEDPSHLADEYIFIPRARGTSLPAKALHRARALLFRLRTGLRTSNYELGEIEFTSKRLKALLGTRQFDCVLFEYWHAHKLTGDFQERDIPCVLDMHDVLWQSHAKRLNATPWLPAPLKQWALKRYQERELEAWKSFDALIAIAPGEHDYVRTKLNQSKTTFCTPMGVDTEAWAYGPEPTSPPRFAFYGNFSSDPNQEGARRCVQEIMPKIWAQEPKAELWLVGGQAPQAFEGYKRNPKVKGTGYVEDPAEVLRTMRAVLCPWQGTYGFRSRLVEVMALGVPVLVTPDAIHGMGLKQDAGVLVAKDDQGLATLALKLLEDPPFAASQGQQARAQVEEHLSLEATYGRLTNDLLAWLKQRQGAEA